MPNDCLVDQIPGVSGIGVPPEGMVSGLPVDIVDETALIHLLDPF